MVDYLETFEVYDIEVGIYSKLNEYRDTCTRGQGHSVTFVQGHSYCINFKQLTIQTEVNLHVVPS